MKRRAGRCQSTLWRAAWTAQLAILCCSAIAAQGPQGTQPSGGLVVAPNLPSAPLVARHPSSDPTNISGTWQAIFQPPKVESAIGTSGGAVTIDGHVPPFNAAGSSLFWHRVEFEQRGTPIVNTAATCRPGLPFTIFSLFLAPFRIVQASDQIVFLAEAATDRPWVVRLDRGHPTRLTPSYVGDSVGHWEGPTLVIDMVGFNRRTWLDPLGAPHGEKLHAILRINKVDKGAGLRVLISVEDPEYYVQAWTEAFSVAYKPDVTEYEVHCLENVRAENNQNMVYEDIPPVPGVNQ